MFPNNNPLLVEKLVHARQEEIRFEVQNAHEPSILLKVKSRVVMTVVLLVALAWLFSV
jgi:hypothetical protein